MVSFIVRFTFAQKDRAEVTKALLALTTASRNEPGCASYIPHHIEGDMDTILIYEQYVDADALDQHRASAHFHQHAVGGLFQWMRDRSTENLIALA